MLVFGCALLDNGNPDLFPQTIQLGDVGPGAPEYPGEPPPCAGVACEAPEPVEPEPVEPEPVEPEPVEPEPVEPEPPRDDPEPDAALEPAPESDAGHGVDAGPDATPPRPPRR